MKHSNNVFTEFRRIEKSELWIEHRLRYSHEPNALSLSWGEQYKHTVWRAYRLVQHFWVITSGDFILGSTVLWIGHDSTGISVLEVTHTYLIYTSSSAWWLSCWHQSQHRLGRQNIHSNGRLKRSAGACWADRLSNRWGCIALWKRGFLVLFNFYLEVPPLRFFIFSCWQIFLFLTY